MTIQFGGKRLIILSVQLSVIVLYILSDQYGLATAHAGDETSTKSVLNDTNASATDAQSQGFSDPKVWIVSFVSIVIISAVGLLCVGLVPLVETSYYNHFIQFLVALAVGSLTGDAMLHLLPHAIVKSAMEDAHAERCHNERQTVFKGLVALVGVYVFFMAEKLVALGTEGRARNKSDSEKSDSKIHDREDYENHENHHHDQHHGHKGTALMKTCDDIITTGLNSVAMRNIGNLQKQAEEDCNRNETEHCLQQMFAREEAAANRKEDGAEVAMVDEQQEALGAATSSLSGAAATTTAAGQEEESQELVRHSSYDSGKNSGSKHHSLSNSRHGHGHSHEMPESMASVALMVILGDGLHNFTDGLAIGAAFAQNITGGISTSVAVLCHELPHELGDFAVLLKTGMKVKQALFYNFVSSILAAIGMVIGICLANVHHATYWIFAVTGGIFIYISLVDMLPELNLLKVKHGESRIAHFLLQLAGIATGVGVMFLIAWFEHDIKGMLGDNKHDELQFVGNC